MPYYKCEAQAPFGKRIDPNVSVQAYIETFNLPAGDPPHLNPARTEHVLRFDLTVSGRHVDHHLIVALFCIADGRHYGEQSGPEWEALQAYWQSQYDYIAKYLPEAISDASLALQGEAVISQKPGWDMSKIAAESDIEEIRSWEDKHRDDLDSLVSAHQQDGRWPPHMLVGYLAECMWARLRGEGGDLDSIRVNQIGSITPDQHEKVISEYPEYARKWNEMRAVIRTHPNDWREVIAGRFRWLPEDLLEALLETVPDKEHPKIDRPKYRPSMVALVHLARAALLLNAEGGTLGMSHYSSIRRTINAYSDAAGRPRLPKLRD